MNREDIIEKVFPHSLFGYDPVAVDAFLDEVIMEFDRMTNTIDVLQFKLAQELGEAKPINELLAPAQSREEFEERVEELIASVQPQIEAPVEEPEPAPEKEPPIAAEAPEAEPAEPEEANEPTPDEEFDAPAFVPEAEEKEPAAEEIQLMTRREIKKMIREEKALERKVRREKKKAKGQ